jgi:hypothetical protein
MKGAWSVIQFTVGLLTVIFAVWLIYRGLILDVFVLIALAAIVLSGLSLLFLVVEEVGVVILNFFS